MAKSALLKSSIAKKYWMALTGLFLCLFLAGHLAGNLQLLLPNASEKFNAYALFMTTNPAVKILSYLTYISIIFHAVDGILLTFQNKAARPVRYVKTNPAANSGFASRNMAILGTVILVFIVTHMVNFWARMHFDKNMPLMKTTISVKGQQPKEFYVGTAEGQYYMVDQVALAGEVKDTTANRMMPPKQLKIVNGTEVHNAAANVKVGNVYKDLHKITVDFFRDPKVGLLATLGYVIAMLALAFHLWHGFQSAFQSLGINNKFTPTIKFVGRAFAIIVPLLFAIIPLYIHFTK
ncbi:succinate dehydrogenase [Flavobacterium sediminis]|uniref:Succinate dehydrogenase n=1 Tax=Flavobacterium sediminis TaxID=2201181 RepID=A0A2U8QTE6_9FLAO|nr:succinate dehydrogenase cytochrome b subunit [Flavobacterium sediminis]AWM13460.1 succinate dehydrogenase [Flavobacterium sediminis]